MSARLPDPSSEKPFEKVALLGCGLIGGSFAYALHHQYPGIEIAAYDPSPDAKPDFIITAHSAAAAVERADLIVFAAPPGEFGKLAQEITDHIQEGAIVTDVGSVKSQAIDAIKPEVPDHAVYVPGHPIAGKAESGIKAADAELFHEKKVILTPDEPQSHDAVNRLTKLWQAFGAHVEIMPPEVHDLMYAYVSHLPQVVAFAMSPLIDESLTDGDEKYKRFTRLTGSDVKLWADICAANSTHIARAIDDFMGRLSLLIDGGIRQGPDDSTSAPLEFSKAIGKLLEGTAKALTVERTNAEGSVEKLKPADYAGTGFKDMIAMLPEQDETIIANREVIEMYRALWTNLKNIRQTLDNRKVLKEKLNSLKNPPDLAK